MPSLKAEQFSPAIKEHAGWSFFLGQSISTTFKVDVIDKTSNSLWLSSAHSAKGNKNFHNHSAFQL